MGELQKRIKTEILQELNLWYSLDKDIDWHINELMAPIINVIEEMRITFPFLIDGEEIVELILDYPDYAENPHECQLRALREWFVKWFGAEPTVTAGKTDEK